MKHEFKDSASIAHIDCHDEDDTLEIKFTSGAIYHYPGCGKAHYDALKNAASVGKYFHSQLRKMPSKRII